ncbi:hypothetical protein BBJ28_00012145 [Nothophytophthora sp. Chile5]|nr:hypothetical protein BBJ28_00012145 [Nothophytophthora sp. Chile5]
MIKITINDPKVSPTVIPISLELVQLSTGNNFHTSMGVAEAAEEAAEERHVADVRQALMKGADVGARDSGTWTPLIEAASNGLDDAVQLLLDQSASIDAQSEDGRTALHQAAVHGHQGVARLLLSRGALVDVADNDGFTPLALAASSGHDKIVQLLLDQNAHIDVRCKDGSTTLLWAAFHGHLSVVRLLLGRGASIDLADEHGSTPLVSANAKGYDEIALLLRERETQTRTTAATMADVGSPAWEGDSSVLPPPADSDREPIHPEVLPDTRALPVVNSPALRRDDTAVGIALDSDQLSSEPKVEPDASESPVVCSQSFLSQLDNCVELCNKMAETQAICEDVLKRLFLLQYWIDDKEHRDSDESKATIYSIATRFNALLVQHANKPTIERLVGSNTVLVLLHDFHGAIDGVESQIGYTPSDNSQLSWKDQWDEAVSAVEQRLQTTWEVSAGTLHRELPDQESQAGALVLLKSETEQQQSRNSAASQSLLESATKTVARMSGAPIREVPEWFILEHAVQREARPFSSGSYGTVYRGLWRGLKVVIKCVVVTSPEEKRMFLREANIWHKLRHPHVVMLFGACHVSRPCFFVCEEATNGNLVDYLDKTKTADGSIVWGKLYEAAMGLQHLHQNNIVHRDLKCNQILVSGGGVAKLTDFGMSFISSGSAPAVSSGAVRWKAPECLTSEGPPTFKSDVYSLGMCVVEAVTKNIPWGLHLPDVSVIDKLNHQIFMERPAAFESDAHWAFVLSLCAFQSSRRLELSDAIDELRRFRDAGAAKRKLNPSATTPLDYTTSVSVLMDTIGAAGVPDTERALLLLVRKCTDSQERLQMYHGNGIEVLSDLVKNGGNYVVQLYALQCLSWATYYDSKVPRPEYAVLRDCVREATAPELASLLGVLLHGSDQEKEDGLVLCTSLATRGDGDALRDVGIVPPLVVLVRAGTVEQKHHSAFALGNLAANNEANCVEIAREGGISPLVALVRAGTDEQKQWAAFALGNLAANNEANCVAIARDGGISPLVALVRAGTDEQKHHAAYTLGNLAANNEANRVAIARDGGISPLVAFVRAGTDKQKQWSAIALGNLAVNNETNCVEIAREGVISALVGLVRAGTDGQKQWAAFALGNLAANNEANRVAIARDGGISPLRTLVRMGTAEQKRLAVDALRELKKSPRDWWRL